MKNASDQRVYPYAQVCWNSQENHILLLSFLISLWDACQRLLLSIQKRIYMREIPKQHQRTVWFFPSFCYFLTLNNSLTLLFLPEAKKPGTFEEYFYYQLGEFTCQAYFPKFSEHPTHQLLTKAPFTEGLPNRFADGLQLAKRESSQGPHSLLLWHPRSLTIKQDT